MPTRISAPASPAQRIPADFSANIQPRPVAAQSYGVHFGAWQKWNEIRVDANSAAGDGNTPALAEAGKPFLIDYGRVPSDLGGQGEARELKVHYRIDGGPVRSKSLLQRDMSGSGALLRVPAKINIPARAKGEIEYWFEMKTKDGATLWDSDFGKNHRADIIPKGGSMVRFDELWSNAVSGPIKAGGTLRIAFDEDRLKQMLYATNSHGVPTYSISAFVSFNGRSATELPIVVLSRGNMGAGTGTVILEAAIEVPTDATEVALWFRGSSYGGSRYGGPAWDSNFGENYRYPVEPAG